MIIMFLRKRAFNMHLLAGLLLLTSFGCEARIPRISTEQIESIEITVIKNKELIGIKESFRAIIPKSDWDDVFALTLPNKLADSGPGAVQVGTLMIKYKNKTPTLISLYWAGKNPCKVTLDGKEFYYAKTNPDEPDGAIYLLRKVIAMQSQNEQDNKIH